MNTVSTDTPGAGPGTLAPRRPVPRRDDPRREVPGRPGRPGRPAGPATRPAARTRPARVAVPAAGGVPAAARRPTSRTPFILLVLALLGCGLICLLVINTTLAAASFQISNLQRENTDAVQRAQELQQQVSTDASANSIEQRALRLGLRMQPTLNFIDLQTGRRYTMPARVRGMYAVPGYTP